MFRNIYGDRWSGYFCATKQRAFAWFLLRDLLLNHILESFAVADHADESRMQVLKKET